MRERTGPATPARRSVLRSVAVPTEHGGWGLTLEPAVLGLLVAPSGAGVCLALAAVVAFVLRTPLKIVLVDRWRHRYLERTRVAEWVVITEGLVLGGLVAAAVALARSAFWIPAAVALPLVGIELWFDMRSKTRRLVPELAGAAGISAVVAMIVLADGEPRRLAAAVWLVLAARVLTSIPWVRAQIARLHDRLSERSDLVVSDLTAVAVASTAVWIAPSVLAGAVAVVVVVLVQRALAARPLPRAAVLGAIQVVLGVGVVASAAVGVLVS